MNSEVLVKYKWIIISFILGMLTGVFGGYFFGPLQVERHFTERIIEREVPVVQETVKHTNSTEIVYVPKAETIEEKLDPATGKTTIIVKKETTDVDVQVDKPTVNVKLNGKPYSFSLLTGETQKFEQGKISLLQESTIGIEFAVKPQVIDRTKTGGIDLFVGRYSGVGFQFNRIGLDIGTNGNEQDFRLRWRAIEW